MKKVLLLPFFLACVAQAAIHTLAEGERGSKTQVILTGPQSNQTQLIGTAGAVSSEWYQPLKQLKKSCCAFSDTNEVHRQIHRLAIFYLCHLSPATISELLPVHRFVTAQ